MIQRTIGLIFFSVIFLSKRINAENLPDVDFIGNSLKRCGQNGRMSPWQSAYRRKLKIILHSRLKSRFGMLLVCFGGIFPQLTIVRYLSVWFSYYSADLSDYLVVGENTVELTLVNNLRNLLGPHHNVGGELYSVAPAHFYNEPCLWNYFLRNTYTEKYSFVDTSIVE